jgi:hypothetical protein
MPPPACLCAFVPSSLPSYPSPMLSRLSDRLAAFFRATPHQIPSSSRCSSPSLTIALALAPHRRRPHRHPSAPGRRMGADDSARTHLQRPVETARLRDADVSHPGHRPRARRQPPHRRHCSTCSRQHAALGPPGRWLVTVASVSCVLGVAATGDSASIGGAIIARRVGAITRAPRHQCRTTRCSAACGYLCMMIWHGGLSGSAPLSGSTRAGLDNSLPKAAAADIGRPHPALRAPSSPPSTSSPPAACSSSSRSLAALLHPRQTPHSAHRRDFAHVSARSRRRQTGQQRLVRG